MPRSRSLRPTPPGRPERLTRDEIPHLMIGDIALELLKRRRIVAAGEAADRHDRRAGLQFQAAGPHRTDCGRRPAVVERPGRSRSAGSRQSGTRPPCPPGPPGPPGGGSESVALARTRCRAWARCARSPPSRRCTRRAPRRRKNCARGQYRGGAAAPMRSDGQHDCEHNRSGQHDPPQRRQPVRCAIQQHEGPDSGDGRHHGQHETRGARCSLTRHSSRTEMPTSAAIAGARATV